MILKNISNFLNKKKLFKKIKNMSQRFLQYFGNVRYNLAVPDVLAKGFSFKPLKYFHEDDQFKYIHGIFL